MVGCGGAGGSGGGGSSDRDVSITSGFLFGYQLKYPFFFAKVFE